MSPHTSENNFSAVSVIVLDQTQQWIVRDIYRWTLDFLAMWHIRRPFACNIFPNVISIYLINNIHRKRKRDHFVPLY